jgi:protein ImuB
MMRTMLAWCPDWPVIAAAREAGIAMDGLVAVIEKGRVVACSGAARAEGVRRGMRAREAQATAPAIALLDYDRAVDARLFEPVVVAVEASMAGVQLVRPGMVATKASGPARYYGGEKAAGMLLASLLADNGVPDARVGIADGPFAAEQAAKQARSVLMVPAGESAAFLGPLPVETLGDANLAGLLRRLGIHDCAAFAALPATSVRTRFGAAGALAHALAAGADARAVAPRMPPRDFAVRVDFEPPLDRVDQIAFGVKQRAEALIDSMLQAKLACTELRVSITTETESTERTWLHPRWFTATDVLDRVRWQLQGQGAALASPVTRVQLEPAAADPVGNHESGLWGNGPDAGVHNGLSRVQGMLGHEGVVTPVRAGGRLLSERQVLVPWGDRPDPALAREAGKPWPGSLPEPVPATVFAQRMAVVVRGARGEQLSVNERGVLSGHPALFSPTGTRGDARQVVSWAGPWPVRERWWDAAAKRSLHRFQLVDATGAAWLLLLDGDDWVAEGRYD